jgi:PAC2 family
LEIRLRQYYIMCLAMTLSVWQWRHEGEVFYIFRINYCRKEIGFGNKNIHKDTKINIRGGIVLDGFPSTGLVNAIASECLIRSIGTELIGIVDSPDFPPVSIIENHVPQFPARIYVNEKLRIAFCIWEVNMGASMERMIAEMIFKWALQHECKMIVSSSGIVMDSEEGNGKQGLSEQDRNNEQGMQSQVMAITSTNSAAKIAEDNGFIRFNGQVLILMEI